METGGEWQGVHYERVAYRPKRSTLDLKNKLEEMLEEPGWVAPPEGHGTEEDAVGAGLLIPAGCSSTARKYAMDGQFHPGDL